MSMEKKEVRKYYDQEAHSYAQMYEPDYEGYPANQIRLEIVAERLEKNGVKTVLDIGTGTCAPMISLLDRGFDVEGIDFSNEMVAEGRIELQNRGIDPSLINQADLDDEFTLPNKKYDAVLALGVFPHILDEGKALKNISNLLTRGGVALIEFRNDLFSTYTLNKYTRDFFLNNLIDLDSMPGYLTKRVIDFYSEKFGIDRLTKETKGKIAYSDILARFHNPLSIEKELFMPNGFSVVQLLFYHYHVLPPIFEKEYSRLFRDLSLKIEDPYDWKGYFQASAFVVEGMKND